MRKKQSKQQDPQQDVQTKSVASNLLRVNLADEMQQAYGEYALANIARTLPDYRDGLIPVQRRLLWTAYKEGIFSSGKYVKSARIVGLNMANYHPHSSSYGALVSITAPWSNIIRLFDGHGAWSTSDSNAAAERYTECKLTNYSEQVLLSDIEALHTKPNYDGTLQEPIYLNAKLPNLLVYGSTGISVGFATNCLQHNIGEVIDSTVNFITSGKKAKLLPDFKQGCEILASSEELENYYSSGKATFRLRAKLVAKEEYTEKRTTLCKYTFENIPHGTNVEKIGEQIKKAIESGRYGDLAIKSIEDESDRSGDRISIISKRNDILELLFQASDLQNTVSANNTVLNNAGVPQTVSATELIELWHNNRKEQVTLWSELKIEKLGQRLHIVDGYIILLNSKIKAIKMIQEAESATEAKQKLIANFGLSDTQASTVLELKLKQITKLNLEEFLAEKAEILNEIALMQEYISDPNKLIIKQLEEIKKSFNVKRCCQFTLRNEVLEQATTSTTATTATTPAATPAKKRFFSLNMAKGIVEAGPSKSNFVAESTDKIVAIGENGLIYKLGCGHKGPILDKPLKILWCEKESKCLNSEMVVELMAKDQKGRDVGKAIKIADLVAATSKGTPLGLREYNTGFRVINYCEITSSKLKSPISAKHHKFQVVAT